MSGFNLAELLPYYLDETDEHIAALNDALLRLEQEPSDARALQEAFRMFHSIKGASVVMGFQSVNQLTHQLENLFDQLRSGRRVLDRPALDLTFRCLDELRDYHRDLRAQGQSTVDLSKLLAQVVDHLRTTTLPPAGAGADTLSTRSGTSSSAEEPTSTSTTPITGRGTPGTGHPAGSATTPGTFSEPGKFTLVVTFEPNLPLADMKARVVLNRLSTKAQVLSTDPPVERLEDIDSLPRLMVHLAAECETDELRTLADVEGVAEVRIEPVQLAIVATSGAEVEPQIEVGSVPSSMLGPARPSTVPPVEPVLSVTTQTVEAHQRATPAPERVPPPASAAAPKPVTPEPSTEPTAAEPRAGSRKAKVAETIRVDSDRLDHLMNLAGELVITKARFVAITRSLEELFLGSNAHILTSDLRERLESITHGLDGLTEIKSGSPGSSLDRWSAQLRRLRDNFRAIQDEFDLIHEAREQLKALGEAIHSLGRVSDGLQKGVLDTRMVPIGPLFERFRRVIRDLSLSSGKEVALQIGGEKTELDKRMIDELSDPLIHMVRNAVDHGLEPPDQRQVAGKSRAGLVTLLASHRGNSVVITVSDDGRGIDCDRIRSRIIAKGLMGKAEAHELSDRELASFIWHPGLSTAETVTEISGRGVGMDIVKSRIENLNGTVDVRSVRGQGTTFTIRLPLTLAIMSSLLVRIYDEIYAIPLDHIDEIVEIRANQIYRVQGQPTIEIRKKIVALVALGHLFRWGGKDHPSMHNGAKQGSVTRASAEETQNKHTVVVVQNGETTIGLLVDQLIGMQEVVLKSLEKNFQAIPGLSGASILGDGRVSLILDLDAIIDQVARVPARRSP
jgi:two-component system chemotaxis sensor kinase CheA